MPEEKIDYIMGAVVKIEKIDDNTNEITFFDDSHTYFCNKGIGMKVSCGYKFGIKDTETKDRYEIVSVEQPILGKPAFKIPGDGTKVVQIPLDDYKDLVTQRNIITREACLRHAIDVINKTTKGLDTDSFKRKTIVLAREFEQYFE